MLLRCRISLPEYLGTAKPRTCFTFFKQQHCTIQLHNKLQRNNSKKPHGVFLVDDMLISQQSEFFFLLSNVEHCLWKLLALSSFLWNDTAFRYGRCKTAALWICLHHVLLIIFHYKQEIFNMYLANYPQKVLCVSDIGKSNV